MKRLTWMSVLSLVAALFCATVAVIMFMRDDVGNGMIDLSLAVMNAMFFARSLKKR